MKLEKLIKGPCDSIVLDNGVEITYFELGREHEEVMLFPGFYFHTFYSVAEALAKRYHVYGVIMRFGGVETQVVNGENQWHLQWGEDVYKFCQAMALKKMHYFGKCHGTMPGWYLAKNHPELLDTFCSFTLAPHIYGAEDNTWMTALRADPVQALKNSIKNPAKVPLKLQEVQVLGDDFNSPIIPKFGGYPELFWESGEALKKFLAEEISVPVCYLFGTEDPLWHDFERGNQWAMMNTKGAKSIILQGERHLMECDCPERMAWEAFKFIEWTRLELR